MTTTTDRYGEILGRLTWAALADEYLTGEQTCRAIEHADDLADYLFDHVCRVWGTDGFDYQGRHWRPFDGQPYGGLADLTVALDEGRALVSTQYCDHPVWTVFTNLRFRIWHDTAHVRSGLGFGTDEELLLFGSQAHALAGCCPPGAIDALFCESVYQLAAYVHLGAYPATQRVVELGPVGRAVRDLLVRIGSHD